jgi:ribosome maturation protein Sdo1
VRPSKGELESAFNTTNSDDIVRKILQDGEVKGGTRLGRAEAFGLGGDKGQNAD